MPCFYFPISLSFKTRSIAVDIVIESLERQRHLIDDTSCPSYLLFILPLNYINATLRRTVTMNGLKEFYAVN